MSRQKGPSVLRQNIEALNACASPTFNKFKRDEDTVSFCVSCGDAKGTVSLSLHEVSRYPMTGGLAFADGADELADAVEAASAEISQTASLSTVVQCLAARLSVQEAGLEACLAGLQPDQAAGSTPSDEDDSDLEGVSSQGSSSEEEDEDQTGMDYEFEVGLELQNNLLRLRHKWQAKDEERVKQQQPEEAAIVVIPSDAPPARPGQGKGTDQRQLKRGAHQIFSSQEATRMLCNELSELMKEFLEGHRGIEADCIDFDIHRWRVLISDIDPDSPLHADMLEVEKKHGYNQLEIELCFTPDMHPFYPTWVKVVRPRFQGNVAQAVMSHARLTLEGWDPLKAVKWVVRFVQEFLEQRGRVALDDKRNDRVRHPEGSYSAAEHALCRLETLSGVRPRWEIDDPELFAASRSDVDFDRIRVLNFGKRPCAAKEEDSSSKDGSGKATWSAGTGYGHGSDGGPVWDIRATEKAQSQKDAEMRTMLSNLAGCAEKREIQPQMLSKSCLLPLLWQLLRNGSLLDVGSSLERSAMYFSMLALLRACACQPQLRTILASPAHAPGDGAQGSVLDALEVVRKQAAFFASQTSKSAAGGESSSSPQRVLLSAAATAAATAAKAEAAGAAAVAAAVAPAPVPGAAPADTATKSVPTEEVAERIIECAETVQQTAPALPRTRRGTTRNTAASRASKSAPPPASGGAADKAEAEYAREMEELQFTAESSLTNHHYTKELAKDVHLAARTKRLAAEASDMLGGALPVSTSSTVWARVDENRMCSWRAMISGPDETPYSGGLFTFDIFCPSDYPNNAPKVNLQTTGGGSVRFNPNLYNCGKVCLSLLGTWQGDQGERWHAKTSTLLQVLMSIQALILVPDPYFNEPGYERTMHTAHGDQNSREYNEVIREGTVKYAMIGQLKKPTGQLEDVIKLHFRLRKKAILEQVTIWCDDVKNSPRHTTVLKQLRTELEGALAKL